jgi:hypothetical protein
MFDGVATRRGVEVVARPLLTDRQIAAFSRIVEHGKPTTEYNARVALGVGRREWKALVNKRFLHPAGLTDDGYTREWTPEKNSVAAQHFAAEGKPIPKSDGYVFGASTKLVAKAYDNTPPAGWVTLFDDAGTPWGFNDLGDTRNYGYLSGGYATTLVDASRIPGFQPWVSTLGVNIDDRRKIDALRLILNHAFDWAHNGGA